MAIDPAFPQREVDRPFARDCLMVSVTDEYHRLKTRLEIRPDSKRFTAPCTLTPCWVISIWYGCQRFFRNPHDASSRYFHTKKESKQWPSLNELTGKKAMPSSMKS